MDKREIKKQFSLHHSLFSSKAEKLHFENLEELQILLAPDKEHQKVFPIVPIVGFRNGKFKRPFNKSLTSYS